jgi:hypothetical protein
VRPLYREAAEVSIGLMVTGPLQAHGPCLVVVEDVSGIKYDLVWPSPGADWNVETQTITVNGVSASIGDRVTISGGPTADSGDEGLAFLNFPPAECISDSQWLVARIEEVVTPEPTGTWSPGSLAPGIAASFVKATSI